MSEAEQSTSLTAQEVAAYLREHPDFFLQQRTLLSELSLPHSSGRAVSLVERQVDILRERNMEMRKQMHDLMQTAHANDDVFAKTRTLTLALISADSLAALNEILATHLLVDFNADFVCCHMLANAKAEEASRASLDHLFVHETDLPLAHLLSDAQSTCTSLRAEELVQVFPVALVEEPGSAVLIKLEGAGILAIGSRAAHHFQPGMDTLFVNYIGDVLSVVLRQLL